VSSFKFRPYSFVALKCREELRVSPRFVLHPVGFFPAQNRVEKTQLSSMEDGEIENKRHGFIIDSQLSGYTILYKKLARKTGLPQEHGDQEVQHTVPGYVLEK
jgi:hypothetical protein